MGSAIGSVRHPDGGHQTRLSVSKRGTTLYTKKKISSYSLPLNLSTAYLQLWQNDVALFHLPETRRLHFKIYKLIIYCQFCSRIFIPYEDYATGNMSGNVAKNEASVFSFHLKSGAIGTYMLLPVKEQKKKHKTS